MLSTNEIRVGTAFMYEGAPFIVQRMLGQKSGRGGMVTRLRVKNIVTGSTQDLGLDAGEKFDDVDLEEKSVKLSYVDGDTFHFMDQETYDDVPLSKEDLGDNAGYISKIDDTYSSIEIHDANETTTLLCSCQSEKCIEQLHDYKVNRKVWLTGRLIEDDKQVIFIITEIAT